MCVSGGGSGSEKRDCWDCLSSRTIYLICLTSSRLSCPSYQAWLYGFVMCAATAISCIAFVLSTMPEFTYIPHNCKHPICVPGAPGAVCDQVICFPEPLPYLDKTETITLCLFIFDYLLRVCTVHAVPQRLIYWDGRRINEDTTVRPSPSCWPSLFISLDSSTPLPPSFSLSPHYLLRSGETTTTPLSRGRPKTELLTCCSPHLKISLSPFLVYLFSGESLNPPRQARLFTT